MTIARYDGIADFYAEQVGDLLLDPVGQCLAEVMPPVAGLDVLDLACGPGRVALELARRGARVTGLDVSPVLLEKAEAHARDAGLAIRWLRGDAAAPDALAGETFDGVTSHFGLSDIDDLGGVLSTVARVLPSGGWFVLSILHPCFPGRGEDAPSSWQPGTSYFAEGWWQATSPGFRGKVGANHRTLSRYLNALVEHGLRIDHLAEPRRWVADDETENLVPTYLVVRCSKP
jgi:ubiquinone/menaquinone biosynthesis C-methylase UbiE